MAKEVYGVEVKEIRKAVRDLNKLGFPGVRVDTKLTGNALADAFLKSVDEILKKEGDDVVKDFTDQMVEVYNSLVEAQTESEGEETISGEAEEASAESKEEEATEGVAEAEEKVGVKSDDKKNKKADSKKERLTRPRAIVRVLKERMKDGKLRGDVDVGEIAKEVSEKYGLSYNEKETLSNLRKVQAILEELGIWE